MPFYLFLRRLRRSPAAFCGLIAIALLVLIALFAPWLAPQDPNWQDAAARLQPPNAQHWLGTDSYGPPVCWWGFCQATTAAGWSAS